MPKTAYNEGVINGKLCRKHSNQYTDKPTDQDWIDTYVDCDYVDQFGTEGLADFVRGCNDGWSEASGASKI